MNGGQDRVAQFGFSRNVGVANMQGLTLFQDVNLQPGSPETEAQSNNGVPQASGSPHLWLAALIVGAAALWIVNQHVAFGPLNLLFILMAVIAGIVLLKTFFGRYYVPGLSPVILAT